MEQFAPLPAFCLSLLLLLPPSLLSRLAGLPEFVTRPTRQNALLLVAGAT
jgi:hypothetical protein